MRACGHVVMWGAVVVRTCLECSRNKSTDRSLSSIDSNVDEVGVVAGAIVIAIAIDDIDDDNDDDDGITDVVIDGAYGV